VARIPKDWVDAYFNHGVDVTNRKVFLSDDVDSVSIGTVIKGLYLMESISQEKPIEFFVGSFGGDEYEMFALYDVLQTLRAPGVHRGHWQVHVCSSSSGSCRCSGPEMDDTEHLVHGTPVMGRVGRPTH